MDRLTRQELLKSLTLFLTIIQSGITLVTLQDGRVYREENTDFPDLIISLAIMSRAHEESQLKSERVGAAWANKRAHANVRPLTKLCPAWLRLSGDRSRYEIIPEKADVIRSIFADTAAGIGSYVITKRLNQKRVALVGKSTGWQRSYVAKILSNRAVIGEYQPHKLVDGRRKPIGDPLSNYFPQVVSEELFYRAQQIRSERRVSGRGRKGKYLSNLFSGLAECAYCHGPMVFENKGPLPKGGTFLVCEGAKRGLQCVSARWRYDHFETSFLAFVEQLDLPSIVANEVSKRKDLDDRIQALQGELLVLHGEMEKAYGLLKLNKTLEFVERKLAELQQRSKELEDHIKEKEAERIRLEGGEREFYQSRAEIKSLIARLQTPGENEDLYKLRAQVSARIKALAKDLEIAPTGTGPIMEKLIKRTEAMEWDVESERLFIKGIEAMEHRRYFEVTFKDGNELRIIPDKDDPTVLYQSVETKRPN